jgi:predicted ATPase
MGTVYRGTDTNTHQTIAIKQLKPHMAQPEMLERFRREGEALRGLNHPNIVKMLDAVEDNGSHYLIMEYVAGGDLAALLKHGQLPLAHLLKLAIDLADALTRAHKLNIVHRDLKPANVLIGDDGVLRLTDFGVAHMGSKERVTEMDAMVGTIDYMPPEAFSGGMVDARGDIWAFGVMLFEMLSGQHPFAANSIFEVIQGIIGQAVPDLQALCPEVSIALVDLIYRMLERDANARMASVRHVGAALEDILQGRDTTPQPARFDTPWTDVNLLSKHNLPAQTTPFVGCEHELLELDKLLQDPALWLITLLASGGMGKTRLALAAAEQQMPHFKDGVYLVELAPLADPDLLVSAIASATDYPFQSDGRTLRQQLLDFLSPKQLLLVMDNFEHLLAGADLMSDILRAAPQVKILATSRERLNLQGETLFRIEGMDVPDWETPEEALEYSAVKLFLQSARRALPNFELKTEDLVYVAQICRRVEGLPLGIVLAAAWLNMLSAREIADEMIRNIDFLESDARNIPERQRSIRAVFDYSWHLLTETERQSFMRLSVFRGGFTREAAQAVAGASLCDLMALVNKSLIRREAATGRYDIHELTRQYAEGRLQAAGQREAAQQALAEYVAGFMVERRRDRKSAGSRNSAEY